MRGMAICLLMAAMDSLDIHLILDNYCHLLYIFKALSSINNVAEEKHMTFSVSVLERCYAKRSWHRENCKWLSNSTSPRGKSESYRVRKSASLTRHQEPWFNWVLKYITDVKYVVSLRLLTACFSVLACGPCKDKILARKYMKTSFPHPYLLLKLFQSLSFPEIHHKYPGQVAEDIQSMRSVTNCRLLGIFVANSLPQTTSWVAAWRDAMGQGLPLQIQWYYKQTGKKIELMINCA